MKYDFVIVCPTKIESKSSVDCLITVVDGEINILGC